MRARSSVDGVEPVGVEHRSGDHGLPVGLGEESLPQLDGVGQIEVEPADLAVVDPLEAGVETGADLDDGTGGMSADEPAYPGVKHRGTQHRCEQQPPVEAGEL